MREKLYGLQSRLKKKSDHATRILVLFFALVVGLGTLLLMLPAASRSGESCGWMTALFTATSTSCVTGLSLVDTYSQWSPFGQVVLLVLIQVGGLGYMTFVSVFYFMLRRKIGLRERLIIQQAMSLNELDGVVKLVKLMVGGTFLVEGVGALILSCRFAMEYPLGQAVWMGVFHSISAYCNAGFDIVGFRSPGSSLMTYGTDPVILLTASALVILGGLGFFVWNDLLMHRKNRKKLSVHTKLVLIITAVLLFGGTVCIALLEWNNPATIGNMSLPDKLLAAFFQSMTTRTAGFAALDQGALTGGSKLISIALMFVGGSSGSTAGGIKTVTVGLVLMQAVSSLRSRRDVTVFKRRISEEQIRSATAITVLVVFLGTAGGVILSAVNGLPLGDCLYESVSAICTVGLSTGITAGLTTLSKLLLIVFMFFGRVGIMTIGFAFMTKTPPENVICRPETSVLIG